MAVIGTAILPACCLMYWVLFAIVRIGQSRRATTRRFLGLCQTCGYDLRATPGLCPECGAVFPNAKGGV
jgi:hypothetical protein